MDRNNLLRPKGFLFDLDGVLVDSREFHWQSWELLQKEVPEFKTSYQEFLETFGQRNDQILEKKIPQALAEKRKQWSERKEELYRELIKGGKLKLLPGIEEFLQIVDKSNFPKIIASSTPRSNLDFLLRETKLGQYFSQYTAGDQVNKGKPAPDVFLAAAEKLGFSAQDCIVLEDSPPGMEAGRAAQSYVVALGTTHDEEGLDSDHYDILFSSPEDLNLDLILLHYHEWKSCQRLK